MENQTARAFNARLAFWTSQGRTGADLYEALANDAELPPVFDSEDIAAILCISPLSVKKQRNRQTGPSFLRLSPKAVRYPRAEFCRYLASKFVRIAA